jgi:hypothetical protein
MSDAERTFPPLLAALHGLPFGYANGDGIDFEPYSEFMSAGETAEWLRAWTGNQVLDGGEYRVFGQDGTGGYAAFWLVRPSRPLLAQPVVFFGSEGSVGVVARNFGDYLWLLAGGLGPFEAVEWPQATRASVPHFVDFAKSHAADETKTAREVIAVAQAEFPTFGRDVRDLCK